MLMGLDDKKKNNSMKLDKKRLRNSFKYAFFGIIQAYKGEQNSYYYCWVGAFLWIFLSY